MHTYAIPGVKISRLFFRSKPRMFCRIQDEPDENSWDRLEQHEGPSTDLLNFLVIPHYNTKLSNQMFCHFWACCALWLWVHWNVPTFTGNDEIFLNVYTCFIQGHTPRGTICSVFVCWLSFPSHEIILELQLWLATIEHSNPVRSGNNLIIIVSPAELMTAKEIFGMLVTERSINLIPQN